MQQASISGMSTAYGFAQQSTLSTTGAILLEDWKKEFNPGQYVDGKVMTSYRTFGLPDTDIDTRASDDWHGDLSYQTLLVDDTTIVDSTIVVTLDNVTIKEENSIYRYTINIEIDSAITLPVVDPAEGGGMFNPEVDDWGDDIIENFPVG